MRPGGRASGVALLVAVTAVTLACSPTLPPPSPAAAPSDSRSVDQAKLLLFPQADAESLLGRAVQLGGDGSWTMADARAPGCEVGVTREAATFHTSRKVDAHTMTSLAAGYSQLLSIEVKFGRQNTADIEIDNSAVLKADLRGACGEMVVDKVFIGHGTRNLEASAVVSGQANVHIGVVTGSPSVDTGKSVADALAWSNDQAYGFDVRQGAKSDPLNLTVSLPSIVTEGDEVTATLDASAPAWLVVYYIDGQSHADVLWPSNEEPAPMAGPGNTATLPSDRERQQGFHIKAALFDHRTASRETLVVYGFADKRDFLAMRPAAASATSDGPAYAAELTKKLQSIPMSRWSRAVVGYVIEPAAAPRPNNPKGKNK